jgi:hypothetical protein
MPMMDLIYNAFLEKTTLGEELEKTMLKAIINAFNSQIIIPVETVIADMEKEFLETDFVRAYYGVSDSSRAVEGPRQWFYDIALLQKIVNKIE